MRNGRGTIGLEEEEKKGKYFAVPANSCKVSHNYFFTTMITSLQTQIVV